MPNVLTKLKTKVLNLKKRFSKPKGNWIDFARTDLENWYEELTENTSEEQRVDTATRLLIAASRLGFADQQTKALLFNHAQSIGLHFLPVHFYSPVIDTSAIPENTFKQRYDDIPNLNIDQPKILGLLNEFSEFGQELDLIPVDFTEHQYYWSNPAFNGVDASILYSMIRKYRPKHIIEIGSGYSTMMGLEALKINNHGDYTCIEPYPNQDIMHLSNLGSISLIKSPVQSLDLHTFDKLSSGDILFIDSTHVCKTGSDVVYEFLKIIPRLSPGVIIHVHDIFFPFEYPESWVMENQLFWNELYILLAFLAHNDSFEMLLPNRVLKSSDYIEHFKNAFPHCPQIKGGSFWFHRVR